MGISFYQGEKDSRTGYWRRVYTAGFPLGQTHLKITKGVISGQQCGLFQTDAPINGGYSGGPLVWNNKVVGINSSGYIFSQNVAYAIPITRLLSLIDHHDKHPASFLIRFPRNWGASFAPPSIYPVSHDNDRNHGLEVRQVFPHQLLCGTSIKKGDIILRINDIPISSLGEMPIQWMSQSMNLYNFFSTSTWDRSSESSIYLGNRKIWPRSSSVPNPTRFITGNGIRSTKRSLASTFAE